MPLALAPFSSIPLDEALLELLIDEHESITLPRLERLWRYYRNPLAEPSASGGSDGPPAQKAGLPARLMETRNVRRDDRLRREIVIENDIAWRIHALVDFMFPDSPRILSRAGDTRTRAAIESVLEAVIDANGGVALWQNAALLGSVYGHVDFLIDCATLSGSTAHASFAANRTGLQAKSSTSSHESSLKTQDSFSRPGTAPSNPLPDGLLERIRSSLLIETVEAPRAIPLLNPNDYRALDAYVLHHERPAHDVERETMLARLSRALKFSTPTHSNAWASRGAQRASTTITDILSATHRQRYEDGALVMESLNPLGRIPVIHVQNLPQPFRYEGVSDVEPLIPLQDELNTRLSDRANRVTMQSFRMWLAKGLEGFIDHPIAPGQMWMTDNPDASIEAFGGDADSPSERQHLEELREALDKASGVTPAAAGHIKSKVGNLTSENALRISLMGTIAKVKRKRITYGAGIEALCEMILHALDVHGVFRTESGERRVEIVWSDALPIDESRRIQDALAKAQLGVPLETLRAELGYA